jgi:hypothetical protein
MVLASDAIQMGWIPAIKILSLASFTVICGSCADRNAAITSASDVAALIYSGPCPNQSPSERERVVEPRKQICGVESHSAKVKVTVEGLGKEPEAPAACGIARKQIVYELSESREGGCAIKVQIL